MRMTAWNGGREPGVRARSNTIHLYAMSVRSTSRSASAAAIQRQSAAAVTLRTSAGCAFQRRYVVSATATAIRKMRERETLAWDDAAAKDLRLPHRFWHGQRFEVASGVALHAIRAFEETRVRYELLH